MQLHVLDDFRPGFARLVFGAALMAPDLQISINLLTREGFLGPDGTIQKEPHFFSAGLVDKDATSATYRVGPEIVNFLKDHEPIEVATVDGSLTAATFWENAVPDLARPKGHQPIIFPGARTAAASPPVGRPTTVTPPGVTQPINPPISPPPNLPPRDPVSIVRPVRRWYAAMGLASLFIVIALAVWAVLPCGYLTACPIVALDLPDPDAIANACADKAETACDQQKCLSDADGGLKAPSIQRLSIVRTSCLDQRNSDIAKEALKEANACADAAVTACDRASCFHRATVPLDPTSSQKLASADQSCKREKDTASVNEGLKQANACADRTASSCDKAACLKGASVPLDDMSKHRLDDSGRLCEVERTHQRVVDAIKTANACADRAVSNCEKAACLEKSTAPLDDPTRQRYAQLEASCQADTRRKTDDETAFNDADRCAASAIPCVVASCYQPYLARYGSGTYSSQARQRVAAAEQACHQSPPEVAATWPDGDFVARTTPGCGETKRDSVIIKVRQGAISWEHTFNGIPYRWVATIDASGHISGRVSGGQGYIAIGTYTADTQEIEMHYPDACEASGIVMESIHKI